MYESQSQLGCLAGDLVIGLPSTITIATNKLLNFTNDSTIKGQLANALQGMATIVSVDRPLFSGRYVVTFVPTTQIEVDDWSRAFVSLFQSLGFDDAYMVAFDAGATASSAPGGSKEVISTTTTKVAKDVIVPTIKGAGNIVTSGVGAAASSLAPVLIGLVVIGGLGLFGYSYVKRKAETLA